jgi:microcystin-dependent protein
MALKTEEELYDAIAAGVHPNNPALGGKTTAASLGAVLRLLAGQLIETQTLAANAADTVREAPGSIKLFAGSMPPAGWAFCDGRLLTVSQYQELFAVLGNAYGGDGTTTFALPDLRGRVALGAGSAEGRPTRIRGEVGGTDSLTLTVDQMPSHTHLMRVGLNADETNPQAQYLGKSLSGEIYSELPTQAALAPDAITNTGAGEAIPILPPFTALHYIICLHSGLTEASTSVLEFVFEVQFADEVVRTMGNYQAGEYRTQQLQNVDAVTYVVNESIMSLPFTLAPGDELTVSITRTNAAQAAIVSLQN